MPTRRISSTWARALRALSPPYVSNRGNRRPHQPRERCLQGTARRDGHRRDRDPAEHIGEIVIAARYGGQEHHAVEHDDGAEQRLVLSQRERHDHRHRSMERGKANNAVDRVQMDFPKDSFAQPHNNVRGGTAERVQMRELGAARERRHRADHRDDHSHGLVEHDAHTKVTKKR